MIVNPYLNFNGNAEEAFQFYQSVFGGEMFIQRMSEAPGTENLSDKEKNMAMHVSLPIGNGQHLMASDCIESQGMTLNLGNNNYIALSTDSREETDKIFHALSAGGIVEMPLEDMFWGDYFTSFKDKYGICWMLIYSNK
ncbi:PhnB protein [Arcticibacter svalbardensis MN12-7]|uniref:PhnB protein n=1 Tax=Arcticibacter svalbardensis MN12-7 TaxID=1150600 RepID=R9GVF7_9SPHI|nr:VOC family protein [Arcticibacter svalbardensis]EOR95515.1 PhnB protein [Arcticibacter svalbardensis MN12-7]